MNTNNYKEQLKKEKAELENLISEMKDNTLFGNTTSHTSEKYSSGELSSYDNHPGDIGTDVYMNDMQNSLTNHQEYQLEKIDDALSRIEDNSFGYCEKCHKEIEPERLEILPEATLCSNCARESENTSEEHERYDLNNINQNPHFYSEYIKNLTDLNKNGLYEDEDNY
ncbi:MAG: TraR/DksA family transcriptional regulator [Intestinibacter sp.]